MLIGNHPEDVDVFYCLEQGPKASNCGLVLVLGLLWTILQPLAVSPTQPGLLPSLCLLAIQADYNKKGSHRQTGFQPNSSYYTVNFFLFSCGRNVTLNPTIFVQFVEFFQLSEIQSSKTAHSQMQTLFFQLTKIVSLVVLLDINREGIPWCLMG